MTDDSPFHKALRWRVHDPDEALAIAASHRRQATEARCAIPDPIHDFRAQSQAAGLRHRARCHDEIAEVCGRHAEELTNIRQASLSTTSPAVRCRRHPKSDAIQSVVVLRSQFPVHPTTAEPWRLCGLRTNLSGSGKR